VVSSEENLENLKIDDVNFETAYIMARVNNIDDT
jgi:hypothetical protein